MPKPSRPWSNYLALWIQLKVANPTLSAREFFRQIGVKESFGARKIGKRMGSMWEAVREKSLADIEKKGALNLTKEVEQILKAHKQEFNMAVKTLLVPGEDGKTKFAPSSFTEAMRMLHGGSKGIQGAVTALSGGEPLIPTEARKYKIEWVPEDYRANPEPKRKAEKSKLSKKKKPTSKQS